MQHIARSMRALETRESLLREEATLGNFINKVSLSPYMSSDALKEIIDAGNDL